MNRRCKSCGAIIKFVRSLAGKPIPVNPEFVRADGEKVLVFPDGATGKARGSFTGGYVSHFATCPDAAFFKRVKRHRTARAARPRAAGR
ncbi:MAG TPA: hypothetical protein VF762_14285 [Blastocatellia bacterium]